MFPILWLVEEVSQQDGQTQPSSLSASTLISLGNLASQLIFFGEVLSSNCYAYRKPRTTTKGMDYEGGRDS